MNQRFEALPHILLDIPDRHDDRNHRPLRRHLITLISHLHGLLPLHAPSSTTLVRYNGLLGTLEHRNDDLRERRQGGSNRLVHVEVSVSPEAPPENHPGMLALLLDVLLIHLLVI